MSYLASVMLLDFHWKIRVIYDLYQLGLVMLKQQAKMVYSSLAVRLIFLVIMAAATVD